MNEEWWRMKYEWWRMMISSCWGVLLYDWLTDGRTFVIVESLSRLKNSLDRHRYKKANTTIPSGKGFWNLRLLLFTSQCRKYLPNCLWILLFSASRTILFVRWEKMTPSLGYSCSGTNCSSTMKFIFSVKTLDVWNMMQSPCTMYKID